jgi:hypothetical protein
VWSDYKIGFIVGAGLFRSGMAGRPFDKFTHYASLRGSYRPMRLKYEVGIFAKPTTKAQ